MRDGGPRIAPALVALALACGAARGAAAPLEALSFDEAVRTAIEQNLDGARAEAAIRRADALLRQARAVTLPSAGVTATESVIDSERGFEGTVTQPANQFVLSGYASVPLLAPALWAARTQAADQVEVARLAAADTRRRVAVAAAQAYLAVIASRRQVEVDERARDNAQAQFDYAQTRFEGGAGSKLNALRAAELLATSDVLVERSRLVLRLSQEALGLLLAADRPIDAVGEPAFETPPAAEVEDLTPRTDLRLFSAESAAAERVVRDSWKDWVPTIEAAFVPQYVSPAGAFEDQNTWRATLGLRFPLYLGGQRRADRYLREAQSDAARVDLRQAELDARAEVRASRLAIEAAERAAESARRAAEHGNEVLRITEVAFRAGATTNIELIDAQRRARDTETAVARAEDILRQARLELLVALGRFPPAP